MKKLILCLAISLAMLPNLDAAEAAETLTKVDVLPLALTDDFEFRKSILYFNTDHRDEERFESGSANEMVNFEKRHKMYGALTRLEQKERYGQYFTFFWRGERAADIKVRLEYRQEKLGPFVQAKEIAYDYTKGTVKTQFRVTGEEYRMAGRVTSWRALLIEDGRIVGLEASYLWN